MTLSADARGLNRPNGVSTTHGYAGQMLPYLNELQTIFLNAGIDVSFVNSLSPADFELQNTDLRSLPAFGYAPPGTNLAQFDSEAIRLKGQAMGETANHIGMAIGIVVSHEIGHN